MKKRITGAILAIMMLALTVVTGCSLVTTNWNKYYNATVSIIYDANNQEVAKISKRELVNAYERYRAYFEQYYGTDNKEAAVNQTLEQLESQKLMVLAAEKQFKQENADGEVLSKEEKAYLWEQTNDALQTKFLAYVDRVSGNTSSASSSTNADLVRQTIYHSNASLNSDYTINKKQTTEQLLDKFDWDGSERDATQQEYKMLIYNNLVALVESVQGSLYSEAFTEYRKALQNQENGLNKDKRIVDLFISEIESLYKDNYENYLIQKYTEQYRPTKQLSDVTVNQMLELYINKVLNSYTKYEKEGGSYESDVLSDLSQIYYFKNKPTDTKFYTVAHILFKFDDPEMYTQAQTELANHKISQEEYDQKIADLAVTPVVRKATSEDEDGIIYEEVTDKADKKVYEYDVNSLYTQIKTVIDGITDPYKKAEQFDKFIYLYNEDPGIMNAEYNYVMGLNKSEAEGASESEVITLEDGRKYKSYSNMVSEFTLAGAELYDDGRGQIGDLSPLIITENGFHILMYTGACQNYFTTIVDQFEAGEEKIVLGQGAIDTLNSDAARLNARTNKKIFDVLYDELAQNNFSTFQSETALMLRQDKTFKHFDSQYRDLF